ncbi:MAG: undecaprenyl-diphosphate phosphatase [Paraglaciecola sp.]|nr:undecaprenyl-diphosphate phosphatase [Paraglaciecola sp.]NCT49395.1 undecaprenyl-diphosphate phosphatase [Paraglaciecola sp.]
MSLFEIIVLAIIQGLTEFLPISSSAHLILPSAVLGWQNQGLAFDVSVHVGSLLAVMIYFRHDIVRLLMAWLQQGFSQHQSQDSKLAWWIIVATIPAIIVGYLLKDFVEGYGRSALVIASTTIIFGLLLWYADRTAKLTKSMADMSWKNAILIGIAQAIAVIPGTSRSGITMTAGLMLGLDRESAARFSFLLSIPVILGAGLLATVDLISSPALVDWLALLTGALISFVCAYTCIFLFLAWISRIGMLPFVIYRLLLGTVLLVYVFVY